MSQFIAPHYTREFELRQNRIRKMRKQQEDSRTGKRARQSSLTGSTHTLIFRDL